MDSFHLQSSLHLEALRKVGLSHLNPFRQVPVVSVFTTHLSPLILYLLCEDTYTGFDLLILERYLSPKDPWGLVPGTLDDTITLGTRNVFEGQRGRIPKNR